MLAGCTQMARLNVGDSIWLVSYRRLKTCSFHRWRLGVFILVRYGLMVLPSVGVTILTAWRETILIFFKSQRVVASPGFPCPRNERFTEITAGFGHTCGIRQDGGISCWGNNDEGQATPPGA